MHADYFWFYHLFLNALIVFLFFHRLLPTFMAPRFDFAAPTRNFAVFFLTSNMLVKRHIDFLALGYLTYFWIIGKLGLSSVIYCGLNTIAASRISSRFCWSSHLTACWYIVFMLLKKLCSKEDLLHNDWSIPIVFIWSWRRGYCNIPLITKQCCSNVSIERIESMALFVIRDFTHWASWEYLPLIWKQKYYLPAGGNCFVVCNSTGSIGSVAFNGVKRVFVNVSWTLYFFRRVTHEWMSSIVEVLFLFWFLVISLLSSFEDMGFHVELLADDVWEAEDDKPDFLSVGVDIFDQFFLRRKISLPMIQVITKTQKYDKWG